ncbi:unnamed protein product [Lepeophtheirus salmonis]|uniref:(salmon louse) hypothetical protein n=1 Tax=Lepeophtheirus salmonis TaxID=72036 RepID=A0A7R8H299_LEPSM|nr:unnamed protein product [Lepeophtheirus salmonis]CAF2820799.1 unnamed protein product [Lepeophtheirus salmonis]
MESLMDSEDFPGRLVHEAALWDDAELLEALLSGGTATTEGSRCLRLLLRRGCLLDSRCGARGDSRSALHMASEYGYIENVRVLVEAGSNLSLRDALGLTALDLAEKGDHLECMAVLSRAAHVQEETRLSRLQLLHDACVSGDLQTMEEDLFQLQSSHGGSNTLVFTACEYGHIQILSFLLEKGARPTIHPVTQYSPLYIASLNGKIDIVQVLLYKFPHLILQLTVEGRSPIHAAALNGHIREKTGQWEFYLPFDLNQRDKVGYTCLYLATSSSNSKVVNSLLQFRVQASKRIITSPEKVDSEPSSIEKSSLKSYNSEGSVVTSSDTLISPIEVDLYCGVETSLHCAVKKKDLKIANLLLAVGADPNNVILNSELGTFNCLVEACRNRDFSMIDTLLKHSAKDDNCEALNIVLNNDVIVCKLLSHKAIQDTEDIINYKNFIVTPVCSVRIDWDNQGGQLDYIKDHWISEASLRYNPSLRLTPNYQDVSYQVITRLDLSSNKLREMPQSVLKMVNLKFLSLAANKLESLPDYDGMDNKLAKTYNCPRLEEIQLQDNRLDTLPAAIFSLESLITLDASNNKLQYLPQDIWKSPKLKELNLSFNLLNDLQIDCPLGTTDNHRCCTLDNDLCLSVLESFSNDKKVSHTSICNDMMESKELKRCNLWSQSLEICERLSKRVNSELYVKDEFSSMQVLNLAHNSFSVIPKCISCFCPSLSRLNLSYNALTNFGAICCYPSSLKYLDLSHNQINSWPSHGPNSEHKFCYKRLLSNKCLKVGSCPHRQHDKMTNLRTLILSANKLDKLQVRLGSKIYLIRWVCYANYGIWIPRAKNSRSYARMKLMVVGIQGIGKTTLLELLRQEGGSFRRKPVEHWAKRDWTFEKRGSTRGPIVFRTWDFGGQTEYYSTHQYFLSRPRAPNSPVIIVGTHFDVIKENPTSSYFEYLQSCIRDKFINVTDPEKSGLPKVLDCVEEKLSITWHQILKNRGLDPVLSQEKFEESVKLELSSKYKLSFRDLGELSQATKFLHENGLLLHYDDATLRDLYFLDPQWLCDLLSHVVTIREINPFARNGLMKLDDLKLVFKSSAAISLTAKSYVVNLLNKFEIALTWDSSTLLIPSLLPTEAQMKNGHHLIVSIPVRSRGLRGRKAFDNINSSRSHSVPSRMLLKASNISLPQRLKQRNQGRKSLSSFEVTHRSEIDHRIQRLFLMSYFPSGFWSYFVIPDDWYTDTLLSKIFMENKPEWTCWQSGLELRYLETTLFSLKQIFHESFNPFFDYHSMRMMIYQEDIWSPLDKSSSSILELSLPQDTVLIKKTIKNESKEEIGYTMSVLDLNPKSVCQLLALAVEHIDTLLEDWYPSLGTRFLHTSEDLEDRLRISNENIKRGKLIGQGAFGFVFISTLTSRGINEQQKVAVKILQPTHPGYNAKESTSAAYEISISKWERDPIQYAAKAYCSARQEISILIHLKHPNIVPLIGVCIKPLSIILELAPKGALDKKLEYYLHSDCQIPIKVVQLIVLQISRALEYLHQLHIIYRDLKSENVLVWKFPEPFSKLSNEVHVKLADYGISRPTLPTGTKGFGGTEGFMAPEIVKYNGEEEYTEKVDCFSFGMFIYELITLHQPFSGYETIKELILEGIRPPISVKETKFPTNILDLMISCWSQQPRHRPSTSQLVSIISAPEFINLIDVISIGTTSTSAQIVTPRKEVWLSIDSAFDQHSSLNLLEFSHEKWIQHCIFKTKFTQSITALCLIEEAVWAGDNIGLIHSYSLNNYSKLFTYKMDPDYGNEPSPVRSIHYLQEMQRACIALHNGRMFLCDSNIIPSCKVGGEGFFVMTELGSSSCIHSIASINLNPRSWEIWCGESHGSVSIFSFIDGVVTSQQIINHNNPIVENLLVLQVLTEGTYIWTSLYPGFHVYQWNTTTKSVINRLDCSKLIPVSESLRTISIEECFNPGRCQITSINLLESKLYVGTNWGCVIIAESINMQPITVFRPYSDQVQAIIPIPEHGLLVTLGKGYRPLIPRYASGCERK